MYFSIPETSTQTDRKGERYHVYNVHINGVPHCRLRYRQLHSFHQQLKREFGGGSLPTFPPKKLLTLNETEVEERRLLLEKYLQLVSQDTRVAGSPTFNTLLLTAQQETRQENIETVNLDVYLMNEHRVGIGVQSVAQTDLVLEQVCNQLGVAEEFHHCFALYLIRRDPDGDITVVRKLQDFESPYITLKTVTSLELEENTGPLKIVLRKSCWDSSIDDLLLADTSTLNLLYIQTVADVERGWILTSAETKQELALMQAKGGKRQYMEVARSLKFYGYMIFRPAICDYPEPETRATLALGRSCINMRLYTPTGEIREVIFKVTRIRCWRIMTSGGGVKLPGSDGGGGGNGPPGASTNGTSDSATEPKLELRFEYLMSADKMQWVSVVSSQAILMSLCLQSMVEELVRLKAGERDPMRLTRCTSNKHSKNNKINGVKNGKDSSNATGNTSTTTSANTGAGGGGILGTAGGDRCIGSSVDYTVRKLAEKFSVVNMKSTSQAAENVFIENEMFIEMSDTISDHHHQNSQ